MYDKIKSIQPMFDVDIADDAEFSFKPSVAKSLRESLMRSDVGVSFMDMKIGGGEDASSGFLDSLMNMDSLSKSDKVTILAMSLQGHKPVVGSVMLRDTQLDDDIRVSIPAGVFVIGGLSAMGKSTLLRYFSKELNMPIAIFDEPDLPSLRDEESLSALMNEFLFSEDDFLAVDSLTSFITAKKGDAAAAGGLSNKFFVELPRLSNLFAAMGKTLFLNINFLANSRQVEDMHTLLAGRVSGYIGFNSLGLFQLSTRCSKSSRIFRFASLSKQTVGSKIPSGGKKSKFIVSPSRPDNNPIDNQIVKNILSFLGE